MAQAPRLALGSHSGRRALHLGGVFSILPGLGIWMLPLGLLLIASDVPSLRKPVGRFTIWAADKWAALRQAAEQRSGRSFGGVRWRS
jgi:hypothetical protein